MTSVTVYEVVMTLVTAFCAVMTFGVVCFDRTDTLLTQPSGCYDMAVSSLVVMIS